MSTEAKRPPVQKGKEKGAPKNNGADAPGNDLAATTPELRRELLHSMLLQRRFEVARFGFGHLELGLDDLQAGGDGLVNQYEWIEGLIRGLDRTHIGLLGL